eukprot:GEMP01031583.1.p1 GENE.GEMP01031583.1~~GEMP01031583.1.p1  ORF type:complete len:281 (+),score=70.33 GEMP01031583.1:803-1645(+)
MLPCPAILTGESSWRAWRRLGSIISARRKIKARVGAATHLPRRWRFKCECGLRCCGNIPSLKKQIPAENIFLWSPEKPDATSDLTLESLEGECKKECYAAKDELFFAKDYGYVGGYSQASTAESMMREIYRHGPIVVGIAVDAVPEFHNGKNGKYIDKFLNKDIVEEPGHKFIPPWMWTTHAIVCVGWGEIRGEKYWVVRNSWGKDWGEVGYARIRRGRNDAGLELEAEWATVDLSRGGGVAKARKEGFRFGKSWGAHRHKTHKNLKVVAPTKVTYYTEE